MGSLYITQHIDTNSNFNSKLLENIFINSLSIKILRF